MKMNRTANYANPLPSFVRFLNQPLIKESLKNLAGLITFALGLVELYDAKQILKGRKITKNLDPNDLQNQTELPKSMEVAQKVMIACTKISLIISAAQTRPGFFIISTVLGVLVSQAKLERAFGPNSVYTKNPWHPRHIIHIVALALALPSMVQSAKNGAHVVYKKISNRSLNYSKANKQQWLMDTRLRVSAIFNTFTNPAALQLGNQIGGYLFK